MFRFLLTLKAVILWFGITFAQPAQNTSPAKMPVKEVTVFKDGHAYVLHEGSMPVDKSGNVILDQLPNPVLGTFWPYSANPNVTLQSVTAGRKRVSIEHTATTIRELLEANPNSDVIITEGTKLPPYQATIVKVLNRSIDEIESTIASTPVAPGTETRAQKGNVILLKTTEGTKAVPIDSITDVKFLGKYETKLSEEEHRNLLTLKLDWAGKEIPKSADVGMAYVQKGIRWIPNYRIELDGKGKAVVKLQATLLNELTDLKDTTVHLVIGVPSFSFKDNPDPIGLNQVLSQLSPHFQNDASTQYALSNGMMTQTQMIAGNFRNDARVAPATMPVNPVDAAAPDMNGSQNEDLFVFSIKNITLAKGQRMVVPIMEQTVDYKDVYTLDVGYAPPSEMRQTVHNPQVMEMIKLLTAPKVMHKARLTNGTKQPFTTAPALILKDGKVLSQTMMTYASMNSTVDITIGTAINISVRKKEREDKRTANAMSHGGTSYWRVDLSGSLELVNRGSKAVEVEVTRHILGNLGKADESVKAEKVNILEDDVSPTYLYPTWWHYYSWPSWWGNFNGIGRLTWTAKLEPAQKNEQSYTWHYYWP